MIKSATNTPSLFDFYPETKTLFDASLVIHNHIKEGETLTHRCLSRLMSETLGGTDAEGRWNWGEAHDAAEAALVYSLRKCWRSLVGPKRTSISLAQALSGLENKLPTRTRRSGETVAMQQFSTPADLAFAAAVAGRINKNDLVLEPSAGTGLMAVMAENFGANLALNELSKTRAGLLKGVFPKATVTEFDGEHIDNRWTLDEEPDVIMMNPPFSVSQNIETHNQKSTFYHIRAALSLLGKGGRLVVITGDTFSADNPTWKKNFETFQQSATLVFSAPIAQGAFKKHGTNVAVRLHVFDKVPAADATTFKGLQQEVASVSELIALLSNHLPERQRRVKSQKQGETNVFALPAVKKPIKRQKLNVSKLDPKAFNNVVPIKYAAQTWEPASIKDSTSIYETYAPQVVKFEGSKEHPSPLVQSAAMSSVAPPAATAKPNLPIRLVTEGKLSEAQLESIVYATQAHDQDIQGDYVYSEERQTLAPAQEDELCKPMRKGWFLGDGAGCGKGRQISGVILSTFLNGEKKAVWLSESAGLVEDARRDWADLGGDKNNIVPISKWKLSEEITMKSGIIFLTYATLRSSGREGQQSRIEQLLNWLGDDYNGVIAYDEAHAMANAIAKKGKRGMSKPSKQGLAGLHLQRSLPRARVIYASATGATEVSNLAYAERLGLWLGNEFPFTSREEFIQSMEKGGVAALEVVARDLKALGLYTARAISYKGVEVDIVRHTLTEQQTEIYNKYADAWHVIHTNLEEALKAANINDPEGKSLNSNAKSAARSALESNKQRFFNHLLTAMKMPTLIKSIQGDLDAGRAAVVQIVSTSESLMDRRLAQTPKAEWNNLQVDITPREYVMDYLMNSFPVQAFEVFEIEGERYSRPSFDEQGNMVVCRVALEARNKLMMEISALPPVQAALDQLIQYFTTDTVAEITGRKRRIVKKNNRFSVEKRPGNSNRVETDAFQEGNKQILVFSNAGGTGRSYHADLTAKNQKRRRHYLLEAGWRADKAIQGLGRTHRTNQASAPIVSPVTTDVKGEVRFISTICKRLDSLGALTRGQRETGGQGLFREEDNLESDYARSALSAFYQTLYAGDLRSCSLKDFMNMTGLQLTDQDGSLNEKLPPLSTFLNRLLALRIETQNDLFTEFEGFIAYQIQRAKENGTFDVGVETITGNKIEILETIELYKHHTGGTTYGTLIEKETTLSPMSLDEVLSRVAADSVFLKNSSSGGVALRETGLSVTNLEGEPETLFRIIRPHETRNLTVKGYEDSYWQPISKDEFVSLWQDEVTNRSIYKERFWLVTGLLLPIWDHLSEDNPRVWRLEADCGTRMLGRVLRNSEMAVMRKQLGVSGTQTYSPADLKDMIMRERAILSFANNLRASKSYIAGEYRIELTGWNYIHSKTLESIGCITEYHNSKYRLYVPTGQDYEKVMSRVLSNFELKDVA